jgi:hypothetical protein
MIIKVKILRCSESVWWYNDAIGKKYYIDTDSYDGEDYEAYKSLNDIHEHNTIGWLMKNDITNWERKEKLNRLKHVGSRKKI